jgi:hypothetical protein
VFQKRLQELRNSSTMPQTSAFQETPTISEKLGDSQMLTWGYQLGCTDTSQAFHKWPVFQKRLQELRNNTIQVQQSNTTTWMRDGREHGTS